MSPCSSSSSEERSKELEEPEEPEEHQEHQEHEKTDADDLIYEQFGDLDITTTGEKKKREPSEKESTHWKAPVMRKPERVLVTLVEQDDDVRPVIFRRQSRADRKRTSRNVAMHGVRQLHRAMPTSQLESLPVRTLAYTLEEYLTASQPYFPASRKLGDELVTAAVEHNEHIDAFLFSLKEKRLSQKQKVKMIQESWWGVKKVDGSWRSQEKRIRDAKLLKPRNPQLRVTEDAFLFEQHYLMPMEKTSFLQAINNELKKRTMMRRTTNDAIRDSTYFVREFFLRKSKISLRIQVSMELPSCFAPPTLSCGYYPYSATKEKSQKHYLMSRFREAQVEYLNICYRIPEPPSGYSRGSITDTELYHFHNIGRHIHGFFLVWQEDRVDPILKTWKRYLVDAFNGLRFPLYMPWEQWETRLKVAFDRLIVYDLHLAESLRANRPVFDALAKSASLFQPLSMAEIIQQNKQADHWGGGFTKFSLAGSRFLEAASRCNELFLSAFTMIVGGAKILHPKRRLEMKLGFQVSYPMGSPLANVCEEMFHEVPYPSSNQCLRTRIIAPIEKPPRVVKEKPSRRVAKKSGVAFSRKKLMRVREKIYAYKLPAIREKKGKREPPKRGRKPKDPMDEPRLNHMFDDKMVASDIESDFEGFISEKNLIEYGALNKTSLARSTSSESIFLDYTYGELLLDRASQFIEQKIARKEEASAKRRWRKMRRILDGREIRKTVINTFNSGMDQLESCMERILPVTERHVSKTKDAMRNSTKFATYNIPRVFEKGESRLVDEVHHVLSDLIKDVELEEIAEFQTFHQLILVDHDNIVDSRNELATMSSSSTPLPALNLLAMGMMTGNRMLTPHTIDLEVRSIRDEQDGQLLRLQKRLSSGRYAKREPQEIKYTVSFTPDQYEHLKATHVKTMKLWLDLRFGVKGRDRVVNHQKNVKKTEKRRMDSEAEADGVVEKKRRVEAVAEKAEKAEKVVLEEIRGEQNGEVRTKREVRRKEPVKKSNAKRGKQLDWEWDEPINLEPITLRKRRQRELSEEPITKYSRAQIEPTEPIEKPKTPETRTRKFENAVGEPLQACRFELIPPEPCTASTSSSDPFKEPITQIEPTEPIEKPKTPKTRTRRFENAVEEPLQACRFELIPPKPCTASTSSTHPFKEPITQIEPTEPIEKPKTPKTRTRKFENAVEEPLQACRFELIPPEPCTASTSSSDPFKEPIPKLKVRLVFDEQREPTTAPPKKVRLEFKEPAERPLRGARGLEERIARQKEAERREHAELPVQRLTGQSPMKPVVRLEEEMRSPRDRRLEEKRAMNKARIRECDEELTELHARVEQLKKKKAELEERVRFEE